MSTAFKTLSVYHKNLRFAQGMVLLFVKKHEMSKGFFYKR